MNDQRYVGTVRGIIDKKRVATDYAESMIPHFEDARAKGAGTNLTKYAYHFGYAQLPAPSGKVFSHPTQVSNLMNIDEILIAKRDGEIEKFEISVRYFRGPRYQPSEGRKISDQQWDDLRLEYFSFLDANIARAARIATRIRG